MISLKKTGLLFALMLSLCGLAFSSVPGMVQYIPDSSGEYVYYQDKTFTRDSIVGFLFYNDSTYAVRYYAPANKKESLSEKDITVYFSVNPDANYLELTGENIVGASTQDDVEIVNYLHDLFYELSSRAAKAILTDGTVISSKQDYAQFGGNVTIVFNPLVPIFNIEAIKAGDGKYLLQLQTVGTLASSADKSFTQYKRIDGLPKDKTRKFKNDKKAKKQKIDALGLNINIDSQWTQKSDAMWALGDYAMLMVASIGNNSQMTQDYMWDYLQRMWCSGSDGSYALWQHKKVERSKDTLSIMNVFYEPDTGSVTRDFKIAKKTKDGYAVIILTVFDDVYQKNKAYFDSILKI
ncbi:MAG: hypothetical protein J5857_01365 [Treponema sp.]|nr:hypothetical protein [Treponema sp.]